MRAQLPIISIVTLLPLWLSTAPLGSVALSSLAPPMQGAAPPACTLLSPADVTKALEKPSQPGKQFMDETGCIWSDDPAASDSSRRVAVNTHSLRSFNFASHPAITTIKIESVSGIGDEAFYQIYPNNQSPFIWVRKGNNTFSIRILTGAKPRPFTIDQEKSKEAVLAKAAVSKL